MFAKCSYCITLRGKANFHSGTAFPKYGSLPLFLPWKNLIPSFAFQSWYAIINLRAASIASDDTRQGRVPLSKAKHLAPLEKEEP